jgi:DNA repair protein RadC
MIYILSYCATVIQIKVVDDIIIGNNTYFSFAGDGLIAQYELDFLGLKISSTGNDK